MATRTSSLIVELIDRVSDPARAAAGSLAGINRAARTPVGLVDRVNDAAARASTAVEEARGSVLTAGAAAFGLGMALRAPLNAAAEFETLLEDIGQKADIPTERLGALGSRIQEIARQTNSSATEIGQAVDALVGRGASLDVALAVADPIGKVATAYRAATDELAATTMTATENLKVPAAQAAQAFDIMAQAGKAGAFELRDMATYFPQLGAAYGALGQTGVAAVADLAAAVQVVRKDTGDASTAATNLANVIQKTYAPGTIKKFADAGVDLMAEMAKAAEAGLTPLEAIAKITKEATGGDLSKMGFFFEDSQAAAGVRSLIQHEEEYLRIRAEAAKAHGVVAADYERRVKTAAGAQKRWTASISALNVVLGTTLLPLLNDLLDRIVPLIYRVGDLAVRFPEVTRFVVGATAGLIAFRIALTGLRFLGLLGKSGALSAVAGVMNMIGVAGGRLWGAARASVALQGALGRMSGGGALTGLQKLGIGLRGAAVAVPGVSALAPLLGPLGVAAAAVAAAGLLIWKYWDRISSVLSGVGRAIGEILAPAVEKARPLLDWLSPVGGLIAAGWERAKTALSAAFEWLGKIFSRETLSDGQKAEFEQAGHDAVMALWNGMKSVFSKLSTWFSERISSLVSTVSSLAGRIFGLFGGGESGGEAAPASAGGEPVPHRRRGGPISRGGTYLTSEDGPELITATRSGYVHPNRGGGGGSAPVVTNHIAVHAAPGMDEAALARKVARAIEASAASAFRGVQADAGMEAYG